jgi:hypothetical protein
MRIRLFLACALVSCAGCTGDDVLSFPGDAGGDGTSGDAAPPEDAAADAAPDATGDAGGGGTDAPEGGVVTGVAYARLVDMSPDALPLDVCFSAPGAAADFSQSQPFLKPRSPGGVSFPQVSAYAATPSGKVGVRVVAPNAADCGTRATGFADVTVTLASQSFSTIVVSGYLVPGDAAAAPLATTALPDDPPILALQEGGMNALLRVLHFAPGAGTLDVGKGDFADGDYMELFSKVAYGGAAAAGGAIDANGYLYPVLLSGDRVGVHVDGATTDLAIFPGVSVNIANIATLFLAAGGATPSVDGGVAPQAIRGVFCANDFAQPLPATDGLNPTCAELAQ